MVNVGRFGLLGDGAQADETEEFARPGVARFRAVSSRFLRAERPDLIDIETTDPAWLDVPVVAAVGAPGVRRDLVRLWAGSRYQSVVAPSSWVSDSARLGAGAIVAPQATVSAHVVTGDHVILNIGCSVSHDTRVGDYVTVSPGARIAGNCVLGDGVFIGIGATVSNRVRIAAGAVIGAGAVVIDDVTSQGVYVGVPARKLRAEEEWARAV